MIMDSASTNSKDEVLRFCRHARKYMLSAVKSSVQE